MDKYEQRKFCTKCDTPFPCTLEYFSVRAGRISSVCNDCWGESSVPVVAEPPSTPVRKTSLEKQEKDKERRRQRYLREVGPIPLCACGCGNEVLIGAKNTPSIRIAGHGPKGRQAGYKRKDLLEVIEAIKEATGLSQKDMADIIGIPRGRFTSVMFKKGNNWVSEELAMKWLRPFLFIEGLQGYMIPKKTQSDGGKKKYKNALDNGYREMAPLRDEFLALKEELGASWRSLADYYEMDRRVLSLFWSADKNLVTEERYRFWKKEIGKTRSLSASRKKELFAPRTSAQKAVIERTKLIAILTNFKETNNCGSWEQVARDLDEHPASLRSLRLSKHEMVRLNVYNRIVDKIKDVSLKNAIRAKRVTGDINRTYGITDVSPRSKRERMRREMESV